jgi:malonyl-CoA O-methyltransferase
MIDKALIKNSFSKYARHYDRYSAIQNLCASKLITKIKGDNFGKILDIGCGTGNYTKLLRDKFPNSKIKAVDISPEMIEVAKEKLNDKNVEFIIADGETIDLSEQFDLISSNASFQWFGSLEVSLSTYKRLLVDNGVILFSTFGPLTFLELDEAIKKLAGKDTKISSSNFFEEVKIEKILKSFFSDVEIEQKIYKESYSSLSGLLKMIKYTGTRGSGIGRNGFWTNGMMDNLEKIYKGNSNEITATYQILFCKGVS